MKGNWVYDQAKDVWHLIWAGKPSPKKDDKLIHAWCGTDYPHDARIAEGRLFGFMDVLHDECVRKSEEL